MEDLAEESLYFLLKSDLLSSLEIGRRQNSHSKTEDSGVQDRRWVRSQCHYLMSLQYTDA